MRPGWCWLHRPPCHQAPLSPPPRGTPKLAPSIFYSPTGHRDAARAPLFFLFSSVRKQPMAAPGAALHHLPSSGVRARRPWGAATVSRCLELHGALDLSVHAKLASSVPRWRSVTAPLPCPIFGEAPHPQPFSFLFPAPRRRTLVSATVPLQAAPP
jgi:hypothetical protein